MAMQVHVPLRARTAAGALALALGAAVAVMPALPAHATPAGPMRGGPGWGMGMDADPVAQGKRIEAMVAYRLADVDATPEQRERIAGIWKGATNDLQANRKSRFEARQQAMTLLAAPTIDKAALEKLRVEQMQLADASSRRMLQAMVDSAEVLTPAQRAKLAEKRQQRRGPPPAR